MDHPLVTRRNLLIGAGGLATVGAAVRLPSPTVGRSDQVRALLAARPFTIAHRGSGRDWPEMTRYAYSSSVAAGARALEMSVGRTADGVWFGLHDLTLDRTSQTVNYVASEHTWSEINRFQVSAAGTRSPDQPSRPYLRLDEFLRRYVPNSVAFVDPKAVSPRYYPELIALLHRCVLHPSRSIIAKSNAENVSWARIARKAGLRTWGFYYGTALTAQSTLFDQTQAAWDLLGLDWSASPEHWAALTGSKKIVIGHVITTKDQRSTALRLGAGGIMESDLVAAGF